MRTLEFPWETWRAIIDFLRATEMPDYHEHADILEGKLDQTPADQPLVLMSLSDDIYLRSVNFACWRLGIRLP